MGVGHLCKGVKEVRYLQRPRWFRLSIPWFIERARARARFDSFFFIFSNTKVCSCFFSSPSKGEQLSQDSSIKTRRSLLAM